MLPFAPPPTDLAHGGFDDGPAATFAGSAFAAPAYSAAAPAFIAPAFMNEPQFAGSGRAMDGQQPAAIAFESGWHNGFFLARSDESDGGWYAPPPGRATGSFAETSGFAAANEIVAAPSLSPDARPPISGGMELTGVAGQAVSDGNLVAGPAVFEAGSAIAMVIDQSPLPLLETTAITLVAAPQRAFAAVDAGPMISVAAEAASPLGVLAFNSSLAGQAASSASTQAQQFLVAATVGSGARAPTTQVLSTAGLFSSTSGAGSFVPASAPSDGSVVPLSAHDASAYHGESTSNARAAAVPSSETTGGLFGGGKELVAGEVAGGENGKMAMAGLPVNLSAVDHAVKTIMAEIGQLDSGFSRWWDDSHFKPAVVAAGAAAFGAAAIYYARRRGRRNLDEIEEEASRSWLFARLQPVPSE
ncbi:MAG TPA: hypothetical protein VHX65_15475 [Pirellulales bacterium]|nr:hypothetical protein [Pirellulales bacterium]